MYILKCRDDTYYTGSTIALLKIFLEHQSGFGANYTSKRLPVSLLYFEYYSRIDLAFKREKQVQNWSRKKKEALVNKEYKKLHKYATCNNNSHYFNKTLDVFSRCPSGAEDQPIKSS